MARIWGDSFDYYTNTTDMALRYTLSVANVTILAAGSTAFGVGQAVTLSASQAHSLEANFETGSNETTIYFSLRFKFNSATSNAALSMSLSFQDVGAAAQATVNLVGDGSLNVRTGGAAGTTIATAPAATFPLNSWSSLQGKLVINVSTGSIELRLNGSATPFLSQGSVNTRGGTTNSYANNFNISTNTTVFQIDDLWMNSDNGAAPTSWPGDVRMLWSPVGSGVSSQFTASPSSFINLGGVSGTTQFSNAGNQIVFLSFVATATGPLASLNASIGAIATGHYKMALYDNLGGSGAPGNLLATSSELLSLAVGTNTFSVASGPTLVKGTTYYAAFWADTTVVHQGNTSVTFYESSVTYTGTFPNPQSGAIVHSGLGAKTVNLGVLISPAQNWFAVSDTTEDGDATTVFSNTVGNQDVYGIVGLGTINPASIIGVNFLVFWKKSDSGARTGTIGVAANGSIDTAQISGVTPGLSYGFSMKFAPQDPTLANWTTSSVNGMHISATVAS